MQPGGLGTSWARHLTCVPTDRLPEKCLRLGVPTALQMSHEAPAREVTPPPVR